MVKSRDNLLGAYAFLIGVIFATTMGILQKIFQVQYNNYAYAFLVVIGIIVGFMNVGDRESLTFLLASLSLVIVSGFGQTALASISDIPFLSSLISILSALLVLFVPATIIVALKVVFNIAKI